jgi:uncharacterized protein YlxW (UPF0749 family)
VIHDATASWSSGADSDSTITCRASRPLRWRRLLAPRARVRWLVPVVWAAVGLLMATSASTARGTDLRADRRLQLTELIAREQGAVAVLEARAAVLREDVAKRTAKAAGWDGRIAAAGPSQQLETAAGMHAMTGSGVRVSLDDASREVRQRTPGGDPDDYIVHEQDLQAVVNALRAAGAEAVTLMGRRLISTSTVRCVGNTVILEGRVYGPPFVVTAIGDPERMVDSLDRDPGVGLFRTFVDRFGVRYDVDVLTELTVPAYEGLLAMSSVTAVASD